MSIHYPEKNEFDFQITQLVQYEGLIPIEKHRIMKKIIYINFEMKLGLDELIKEKLKHIGELNKFERINDKQSTIKNSLSEDKPQGFFARRVQRKRENEINLNTLRNVQESQGIQ